tara:strand:- start:201 stop:455 length:255 start_codon:yes stop_codon:yes gene_type:complete
MNKYEFKYFLEQQLSIVDRLTDTIGKQSHHIDELWTRNKSLQENVKSQSYYIAKLRVKLSQYENIENAQDEKNWKDLLGENVDN